MLDNTTDNAMAVRERTEVLSLGVKRPGVQISPPRLSDYNPPENDLGTSPATSVLDAPARSAPVSAPGPKPGYGPIYKVNAVTGCWIWQRAGDDDGYGYFRTGGKVIRAHRYYYEQKHGPLAPGIEPDHTCQNRLCVNPDHIEPVTHLENCRRGRLVKHMTMDRAREVRRRRAEGQPYKQIAAEMKIGVSLIAQIATNRCWKESPDAASPSAIGGTRE